MKRNGISNSASARKAPRSGNCQQCFFSADRTGPHGIGFTRDFFPSLRAIEEAKPELGIAKWEDLLDPDKYMLSIGNLFIGDLPKISPMSNREIMEYLKTEIGDFIQKEYYGKCRNRTKKPRRNQKADTRIIWRFFVKCSTILIFVWKCHS